MVYGFWDVKYSHATIFAEAAEGEPFYINEQAPKDFLDLARFIDHRAVSARLCVSGQRDRQPPNRVKQRPAGRW